MNPSRNQHTIAVSCAVRGRGYWSGREVVVAMNPAPAGSGIRLVRSDLPSRPQCPAMVRYRQDAQLRTVLQRDEARFEMVEHLLAALAALEIDNCLVEIDAEELPGLDGSSAPFVDALRPAGLIVQAKARQRLVIGDRIRVDSDAGWIEASPSFDGSSYFEYQLSFDDVTAIPPQTYGAKLTPHRFAREVAPARTFVTADQAAAIRAQGLASHVTNAELLVIGQHGPIDNSFRFTNECARHKTLDLIGDLALANVDLVGRFVSHRGGHNLNGQMAQRLAEFASTIIPQTPSVQASRRAA